MREPKRFEPMEQAAVLVLFVLAQVDRIVGMRERPGQTDRLQKVPPLRSIRSRWRRTASTAFCGESDAVLLWLWLILRYDSFGDFFGT